MWRVTIKGHIVHYHEDFTSVLKAKEYSDAATAAGFIAKTRWVSS